MKKQNKKRREKKELRSEVHQILRDRGYSDWVGRWGFENQKFSVYHNFGRPFVDDIDGRYSLVSVHTVNKLEGSEYEELVLVDRSLRKTLRVDCPGLRNIHYRGRCELVPTAIEFLENKRALVSYDFILGADWQTPLIVGRSNQGVSDEYFFRYCEGRTAQVDLNKLENTN